MAQAPLRVAIAGLGTVGAGVAKILHNNAGIISQRCGGRQIRMVGVADPKVNAVSGVPSASLGKHHGNCLAMLDEAKPDVVVEAIGGTGIALKLQQKAANMGVNIVTANKALLAKHGKELTELLESKGGKIGFEAAVGGGIPCIKGLKEGLAANNVTKVAGILNGTCNFILSEMESLLLAGKEASFEAVLADAQAKGYAETPPDLDVDGWDTAHKLAILSAIAFKGFPQPDSIYVEGIRSISAVDMAATSELGFRIKLLGQAEQVADKKSGKLCVLQRVHPACIPKSNSLSSVMGVLNAACYVGDYVGPVMFVGRGAGQDATASAVVADLVDMACGKASPTFGLPSSILKPFHTTGIESLSGSRYYLRVPAAVESAAKSSLPIAQAATSGSSSSMCAITEPLSETDFQKAYTKLKSSNKADPKGFNMIRVFQAE